MAFVAQRALLWLLNVFGVLHFTQPTTRSHPHYIFVDNVDHIQLFITFFGVLHSTHFVWSITILQMKTHEQKLCDN